LVRDYIDPLEHSRSSSAHLKNTIVRYRFGIDPAGDAFGGHVE